MLFANKFANLRNLEYPTSLRLSPLSTLRVKKGFQHFFPLPSLRRSRREGGPAKRRPGESAVGGAISPQSLIAVI
jgi:hypothetical protein